MSQANPPRRRWFQFGLGTMLLVVTALAMWLGWELRYIRARKAWLRDHLPAPVLTLGLQIISGQQLHSDDGVIPFWRRWLGDEAQEQVFLEWDTSAAGRAKARYLFPEAEIFPEIEEGHP